MPEDHVKAAVIPVSASALEDHVRKLAEEIGERHVGRPHSLAAARDGILVADAKLKGMPSRSQAYEAQGILYANLSITLPGVRWPDRDTGGARLRHGARFPWCRPQRQRRSRPAGTGPLPRWLPTCPDDSSGSLRE